MNTDTYNFTQTHEDREKSIYVIGDIICVYEYKMLVCVIAVIGDEWLVEVEQRKFAPKSQINNS